jgi:predicted nucleic acid-binding protein
LIVTDASALVEVLLGRPRAVAVMEGELAARGHLRAHAPDVVDLETLNALRKLVLGGRITARRGTEAAADLAATRLLRYPHAPLRERIWELRDELTAYDAAYLALAEGLPDAVLLTADAGLAARGRASLGDSRVRQVE